MTPEEAYWMGYRDGARRERDRNRAALRRAAVRSNPLIGPFLGLAFIVLSLVSALAHR